MVIPSLEFGFHPPQWHCNFYPMSKSNEKPQLEAARTHAQNNPNAVRWMPLCCRRRKMSQRGIDSSLKIARLSQEKDNQLEGGE